MDKRAFKRGRRRIVRLMVASGATLALAGAANAALQGLPPNGTQVNDDPATRSTRTERRRRRRRRAAPSCAGTCRCPGRRSSRRRRARSRSSSAPSSTAQWLTQGFPASLNIDPTKEAEAPVDRLRRRRPHRAVGHLVRAERHLPGGATQHLREPLQRAPRTCGCRPARTAPPAQGPVAQHQHRPRRREPGRRRRRRGGGRRPGAVGGLAGERRRAPTAPATDQIFVSRGRQAGGRGTACTGTVPGSGRERQRLLLAAGRHRPHRPDDALPPPARPTRR